MKAHSLRRVLSLAFCVLLSCLIIAPVALPPTAAQASGNTLRVAPGGSDAGGCGSAASPCRTIQFAVNQAGSGDTILVAAGTYTYNSSTEVCNGRVDGGTAVVCFDDKELTILGGYTASDWSVADAQTNVTIIDGQSRMRGVRVQQSAPSAAHASLDLEGFTIQNGLAQSGSETSAFGGGLFAQHASLVLRDIVFKNNRSVGSDTSGVGGAGVGGGLSINIDPAYNPDTSAVLDAITFDGNLSQGGTGATRGGVAHGGALFTFQATVSGTNLVFTNNKAIAGSSASGSGRSPDGMTADALGGAVSMEALSNVSLQHVTATGNEAQAGNAPKGDAGSAWGGAFFVEGATFSLVDADVRNSLARGGNGDNPSASASLAEGGALFSINHPWGEANVFINRSYFIKNTACSGSGTNYSGAAGGGGIALTYSKGTHQILNTIIADNLADVGSGKWVGGGGGGLWLQGVAADVTHVTFARNNLGNTIQTAGGQGLAAISVTPVGDWPSTANFSYCIIANHTSIVTRYGGRAALQAHPNTTINLNRGLFAGNTLDDNMGDQAPWRGTINGLATMLSAENPGFASPGSPNYDYHITMASPARDQAIGSTTPADIDNQSRTLYGPADLGADEILPAVVGAASAGNRSIQLTWSLSPYLGQNVSKYQASFECPAGAACPQDVELPKNDTSYTVSDMTKGQKYTVWVEAYGSAGQVLWESNRVTVIPGAPRLLLPIIQTR